FRRREGVAGVQRVVAELRVRVAAPVARVRLGDDLDLGPAGVVVVGRERVRAQADLADLVTRRQAAAAEAVDLERGAVGAGQLRQVVGQFVRIIRQRV